MLKSRATLAQEEKRMYFISYFCKSLLWEDDLPRFLQYLFLFASYILCISILVWGQLKFTVSGDGDSLSEIALGLSRILSVRDLIDINLTFTENIIMLCAFGCYFFLFLLAFALIVKSYILRKPLSKIESYYITLLGQLHLSVGFWIENSLLMDYLQSILNQTSPGARVGETVVSLIFIIMGYVIGGFYAFFSYDPFMTSNVLASHSTVCEVSTFLFQAIIAPVIAFSANMNVMGWCFTIISTVILLLKHYHLLASFPYYQETTLRISAALSTVCITVCIVSCIGLFIKTAQDISPRIVYLDVVLIPLCMKLTHDYINSVASKYFAIPIKSLTSKDDVFKKIFSLSVLLKQPRLTISTEADRDKYELRVWGLFSQEAKEKELKKSKSYLKSSGTGTSMLSSYHQSTPNKSSKPPMTMAICNYYTDLILKIKKRTLQEVIEKFKYDKQLKVILAYLALKYNPTPSASLLHLIGMDQSGTSLKLSALKLREKLQKNIDDFFNQNRGRVLDLQTFIELEAISTEFVKLIHANGQKNVNFWVAYGDPQIQVKELYLRSQEIEEESDLIQTLWRRHTAKHKKTFAKSLGPVYGMYLSVVRNTPYLATKTLQKSWVANIGQMIEFENNDEPLSESTLLSSNVLSISASMTRERPGKVLHVSPHITESLGWTTNDVVGQNINSIMPHFMRERHDQILMQHMRSTIDSSATSKMYKNLDTFILEKSGNILPCEVYISIHPTISQTPTYISLVRVKKTQGDQILFNDMGMIEGFTKNVGKLFGLKTDERGLMPNICKNYNEIEEVVQKNNPRKSVKSSLKQTEKIPDSYLDFNENVAKSLTLEFYVADEKNKTRETQTYSGTVTPYYYANTCYYVLTLDQQIVKESEEKFKVQTLMTAPQNFLTMGSFLPQSTLGPNDLDETGRMSDIADEKSARKSTQKLPYTAPPQQKVNLFKKVSAISSEIPDEKIVLTTNAPILYEETQGNRIMSVGSQKDLDQILTTMNDQKEFKEMVTSPVKTSVTLQPQDDSGEPSWKNRRATFFGREQSKIGGPFQPNPEWEAEEEKNKNPALKIVDLNTRAASSVGSSYKAEMVKLEQAVNVVPRNAKLSMGNMILVVFTFLLTGPLIGYQIQSSSNLNLVQGSTQILSKSIFRNVRLTDSFQYARLLLLINNGIFSSDRYASYGYTESVTEILTSSMDEVLVDINTRNNDLRAFVYELDADLQQELYQDDIPIIEMNDQGVTALANRTAKVFDLVTEIVTNGYFALTSGLPFDLNNQYINFIENNTYNKLLVSGEASVNVLISDNSTKLSKQTDYVVYVMIVLGLILIFVLGFFYNLIKKFVIDRNQFISILLTLDRNHIQTQIYMVQKFVTTLEKSGMDGRRLNLVDSLDNYSNNYNSYQSKKAKEGKDSKFRKKAANTGGINGILTTLYLSLTLLLIAMYSAFPALLIATVNGNSTLETKMNLLVQSNTYLYNINSLANTIYEYVVGNISTYTREKPIKEDFDETYQKMTQSTNFILNDLLNAQSGVGDSSRLQAMALGSLCDNIDIGDDILARQCKTMGGGACEKGIVGLNSYIMAALKSVRDNFDSSSRSWDDMKAALSQQPLIDMEIFYPFTYEAYVWIDALLKDYLSTDFTGVKDLILRIIVCYIICYFLVASFIWLKIRSRLEKEMAGWRRMMRLIPQASVVVNKRLRRYLAKHSDGILDAK